MDPISIILGLLVGCSAIAAVQQKEKEDKKKAIEAEQEAKDKKEQQVNNRVTKCPHCNEVIKTNTQRQPIKSK